MATDIMPEVKVSQVLNPIGRLTARLSLVDDGNVSVQIDCPMPEQRSFTHPFNITTTASQCSWNVYSSAKLPKFTQSSNRAQIVESVSNGRLVRIGSAIFQLQAESFTPFTAPHMSLYIDGIDQHGQYIFVTSRQQITTIPEPDDNTQIQQKKAPLKCQGDVVKVEDVEKAATQSNFASPDTSENLRDAAIKEETQEKDQASSSDDDDQPDGLPHPSEDDSSNDLSATQSWSEASTDYGSDQVIRDFKPRAPKPEKVKATSDSESDNSESSNERDSSGESDSQNDMLEGSDIQGIAMSSDDEDRFFRDIYDDKEAPQDEEGVDDRSEVEEEDDDYPEFEDWNRNDWTNVGSDSEECSECGDGGGACALPPEPFTRRAEEDETDQEEPVGEPVAHIHVYDTLRRYDKENGPKRIFHFKRATGQILAASPPAIHPTQPLVVWPLGDNRILFADYESNTYFVRKFPTSQFWSSHISINCHFSDNGKYLHVVALEKSGSPPPRPMRKSKNQQVRTEEVLKPKKVAPKCELIISSYRMSDSKTTRAPPTLIKRVQKDLGELNVLPAVTWTSGYVYISLTKKATAEVYRVALNANGSIGGRTGLSWLNIDLPEWATDRELRFEPTDGNQEYSQLIVTPETTRIPSYKSTIVENQQSVAEATVTRPEREATVTRAESESPEAGFSQPENEKSGQGREEQPAAGGPGSPATTKNSPAPSASPTERSNDAQAKVKHENKVEYKSTHPEMMIAKLAADIIDRVGGWQDVDEHHVMDGNTVKADLVFEVIG